MARGERKDTVDRTVVLVLELIIGGVTQMRRTQRVRQREQRMGAPDDRLFFIHVDCRESGPALFERFDQGAFFDKARPARR